MNEWPPTEVQAQSSFDSLLTDTILSDSPLVDFRLVPDSYLEFPQA